MSHLQSNIEFHKQQQSLTRWLQPGVSRLREAANIPKNLISDQTVQRTCGAASNDLLIKTAQDLGLADTPFFDQAISTHPDLNIALVTAKAQNIMRQCVAEQQPARTLEALAKVVAKLTARMAEGTLQDTRRIMRVLLALASASFFPGGAELLSQFGAILNCHEPHRMIEKITGIAVRGDSETMQKIDDIIVSSSQWSKWLPWFMEEAQGLAPQCWGKLTVSRKSVDQTPWDTMWDTLLNPKEEANGS